MSKFTNQIAKRDFETQKFDGGARESFQFVKFFQLKIDEAGISSILSLALQPNVTLGLDVLYTRGENNYVVEIERKKFHQTLATWETAGMKWDLNHH